MSGRIGLIACARIGLGLVLLASGAAKFADPGQDIDVFGLYAFTFGVSRSVLVSLTVVLELGIGAALLVPRWSAAAAFGAFALLCLLTSMALIMSDGQASCGCFGQLIQLNWQAHLQLNAVLLLVAYSGMGSTVRDEIQSQTVAP